MDMDQTVVDYQFMPNSSRGDHLSGLLVAASMQAVCKKNRLATAADLHTVMMDVDSIALVNCFSVFGEPLGAATVAILNITNTCTNLIVFAKKRTPFIRNIPIGAFDIIAQIARSMTIPYTKVESAIYSTEKLPDEIAFDDDILSDAIDPLAREITETLRYYTTHNTAGDLAKIYLCGDGALITGMDRILDKKLSTPLQIFNPLENIHFLWFNSNKVGRNC